MVLESAAGEHHSNIVGFGRLSQGSDPRRAMPRKARVEIEMDKQSTIRSIRSSYKIDQVENGWTVSTGDGNMFVFSDSKELAEWFCMIVGVPMQDKRAKEDPLELEIRKLVKNYNLVAEDVDKHFLTVSARN